MEAAVFVLFVVYAARVLTSSARAAHSRSSFKSRIPERHSGDAGAIPADRSIFFFPHPYTRRAPACAAKPPKLCELGAAPRRRATFSQLRGRQVERRRPHKPFIRGFDSRPRYPFSPGPLDHSGGHPPRKRESTVQSRGGPPFPKHNQGADLSIAAGAQTFSGLVAV